MADAFRQELAPWGVRVVLVEPCTIASEAAGKLESDAEQLLRDSSSSKRTLYEDAFRRFVGTFAAGHRSGSSPQVVAEAVSRVLASARPRARHLVGKNSRRLAVMARLPAPLADAIRRRLFHLPEPGSLR